MLQGKTVFHATFGPGTVVSVKEDVAYVQFRGAGRGATRKFLTEALFNDELFPRAKNAEVWKVRGMDAFKRSNRLVRKTESEAMWEAIHLASKRTPPPDPTP